MIVIRNHDQLSDRVIDENIEEGSLEFYNHRDTPSVVKVIPKIMIEPSHLEQQELEGESFND